MPRFTTCGLTILLALAPAALAVDGIVLINQSTSTGLPGCPNFGRLPIVICQPGSYRLSGNITVPDANTDAIDINADNVTLDLNGFLILGPVVCSGSGGSHATCSSSGNGNGISSTNSNITVSNGTIRGLGFDGIQLTGSGARVERVNAISNGKFGIEAGGFSGDAIITLCHANSNGSLGIVGRGMLSNTSALSNNLGGVSWIGSVIGSVSSRNGGNGLDGAGIFIANTVVGNSNAGIFAANNAATSVIMSNYLDSNGTNISATIGSVVLNNAVQ